MILSGFLEFEKENKKTIEWFLSHELQAAGSEANKTSISIDGAIYILKYHISDDLGGLLFEFIDCDEEKLNKLQKIIVLKGDQEKHHQKIVSLELYAMDLEYPLRNILLNVTRLLYEKASLGDKCNLKALVFLERLLQETSINPVRIKKMLSHYLIQALNIENEKVLTWKERQNQITKIKEKKKLVWGTTLRMNSHLTFSLAWLYFVINLEFFLRRLKQSPKEHLWEVTKKNTIDKIVWFFKTVRNNLGYSIALAVYGPFTYYFITMPMNPHAMQAVGKVRQHYLNFKSQVSAPQDSTGKKNSPAQKQEIINWEERMGNFKQMQIAYEKNIDFATRMGRLEQLETQFNFPLQIESTWNEIIDYEVAIDAIIAKSTNSYLLKEKKLISDIKVYLWERFSQYLSDQIYIMLDIENEHHHSSYYTGHAFIFMQEMTQHLNRMNDPRIDHKIKHRIEALARFYQDNRIEHHNIVKNLESNSKIFVANKLFNTRHFRDVMKRQWEILYLQNSKAEEAANNGLNMYQWSIRNTVWILQTVYSIKKKEITHLNHSFKNFELNLQKKNSLALELLFHNLLLEYSGLKTELQKHLTGDHEILSRKLILNELKNSLVLREKIINDSRSLAKNTALSKQR